MKTQKMYLTLKAHVPGDFVEREKESSLNG